MLRDARWKQNHSLFVDVFTPGKDAGTSNRQEIQTLASIFSTLRDRYTPLPRELWNDNILKLIIPYICFRLTGRTLGFHPEKETYMYNKAYS